LRTPLSSRGMTLTGGMSSLLLAFRGPLPISEEWLVATLRAIGVLGTASPLLALIDAVWAELDVERPTSMIRAAVIAFLLAMGVGAAGYQALAAAGFTSSAPTEQHGTGTGCTSDRVDDIAGS
jgi:hypothetical protein